MKKNHTPGNSITAFIDCFKIEPEKQAIFSFESSINFWIRNNVYKTHLRVMIETGNPCTIRITGSGVSNGYPIYFSQDKDRFNFIPGQCLIVDGSNTDHGRYVVIISPEMIKKVKS